MLIFIMASTTPRLELSTIQIHLMLIFIWRQCRSKSGSTQIQIHLMLIFIGADIPCAASSRNSNTSHVNLYPAKAALERNGYVDSNTSHVNLYPTLNLDTVDACLYSNTSHVNLYRKRPDCERADSLIQIHLMLIFIFRHYRTSRSFVYSNTSHVNLYLASKQINIFKLHNSNTSHVNLYPDPENITVSAP